MKLLGKTKYLVIETENWNQTEKNRNDEGRVKYPLYEDNYISGLKMVFQQALEEDEWKKRNKERYIVDEKHNIWSFIGRRGSGKTTAMDEFCQILKDMEDEEKRRWWISNTLEEGEQRELRNKKFSFHILKPIDAALLGDTEDLFELILANLYRKFAYRLGGNDGMRRYEYNSQVQKIMELFSEISKMYRNINETSSKVDGGSSLVYRMQFLAGSLQIQESITSLIDELFLLENSGSDYEYIVIAIDDLDLNLRHGYEMLEQLQKYFSYYKILVLIAVDYEQIVLDCEEHFGREMPYTTRAYGVRYNEHNRLLANDYMTKLFHYSQRMYMPDMKKIVKNALILVDKDEKKEEKIRVKVKEFVMAKIAESMHIFYDGQGMKSHFCEPGTVRELVSYNEFLESLNRIDYEDLICIEKLPRNGRKAACDRNTEILKRYDQNHERFNKDIYVRMAQNMLNPRQKKAFDLLIARDLERRTRYFVGAKRVGARIKISALEDTEAYTYGKLLETIYSWGRYEEDGAYYIEDRAFISCVLASFTSEMVREYLHYRHNTDEKRREKYKRRLLEFIGKSFSNEWSAEAFPKIISPRNGFKPTEIGYIEHAQARILNIRINLGVLENGISLNDWDKGKVGEIVGEWLETEKVIETLECISMFFAKREKDGFRSLQYSFRLEHSISKKKGVNYIGKEMVISGGYETIPFDMMAFVALSLNYEEELRRLHENISDELTKVVGVFLECLSDDAKKKDLKDIMDDQVRKQSKLRGYINKHDVAFPFYDLDLAYNVYKRVRRVAKTLVVGENIFSAVIEFYECIVDELEKECGFYCDYTTFEYVENFKNCPYIRLTQEIHKENSEDAGTVYRHINAALNSMTLLVQENLKAPEDETAGAGKKDK